MPESSYSDFLAVKELADKFEWMQSYDYPAYFAYGSPLDAGSNDFKPYLVAKDLAQAVCNEGMALFSAFAMLLHYQRHGKMRGMGNIIAWSVKDETLHCTGMSHLFKEFCSEYPEVVTDAFKHQIYKMYRTAVEIEDNVIDFAFAAGPVSGLTSSEMHQYIRYIADRRLIQIGLKPNWNVELNPLPWIDWIVNGDDLSAFFETRVTSYESGGLVGNWGWEEPE